MKEIIKAVKKELTSGHSTTIINDYGFNLLKGDEISKGKLIEKIALRVTIKSQDEKLKLLAWFEYWWSKIENMNFTEYELNIIIENIMKCKIYGSGLEAVNSLPMGEILNIKRFELYNTGWKLDKLDKIRYNIIPYDSKYENMQNMQNIETGELFWYFGEKIKPFVGFKEFELIPKNRQLETKKIPDEILDNFKKEVDLQKKSNDLKMELRKLKEENPRLIKENRRLAQRNYELINEIKSNMKININLSYSEAKLIRNYLYDEKISVRRLYKLAFFKHPDPLRRFKPEKLAIHTSVVCSASEGDSVRSKTIENHYLSDGDYLRDLILNYIGK